MSPVFKVWLALAVVLLCIALAGCKVDYDTSTEVHEHRLEDGTRCAVLVAAYNGPVGITCDWGYQCGTDSDCEGVR